MAEQPKMIGPFDVAFDGEISLHGQKFFPKYNCSGGLSGTTISYRWIDGKVVPTVHELNDLLFEALHG